MIAIELAKLTNHKKNISNIRNYLDGSDPLASATLQKSWITMKILREKADRRQENVMANGHVTRKNDAIS